MKCRRCNVTECWILSTEVAVKNMDGEAGNPAEADNWNFLKFVHAPLTSVGVEFSSPNAESGEDKTRLCAANSGGGDGPG